MGIYSFRFDVDLTISNYYGHSFFIMNEIYYLSYNGYESIDVHISENRWYLIHARSSNTACMLILGLFPKVVRNYRVSRSCFALSPHQINIVCSTAILA